MPSEKKLEYHDPRRHSHSVYLRQIEVNWVQQSFFHNKRLNNTQKTITPLFLYIYIYVIEWLQQKHFEEYCQCIAE